MKLKCRVTSVLILLTISCLFITFKLFTNLESLGGKQTSEKTGLSSHSQPQELLHQPLTVRTEVSNKPPISSDNKSLIGTESSTTISPWEVWSTWVQPTSILYPVTSFYSAEMNALLDALSTYPVTKFGVGHRGTQLKATLILSGNQRSVFKPKRFSRDEVVDGPDNPYAGYDRHNGEIAAFHLDGILGFGLAPPVAGRNLNLSQLIPLTEKRLFETYIRKDGNICFYGKCYYCKPSDLACADGMIMEGSVTVWLPGAIELKTWRHPYQRTYAAGRKAEWEKNDDYCSRSLLVASSKYYHLLPDIMDTSVFDYLIGNADRHHFETFASLGSRGRLLHIDSGKSFGNPTHDETSILAPLRQCCRLRNSTWNILQSFVSTGRLSKTLDNSMKRDQLYPILTQDHLIAIDRRLKHIVNVIENCIKTHGRHTVLFDVWK